MSDWNENETHFQAVVLELGENKCWTMLCALQNSRGIVKLIIVKDSSHVYVNLTARGIINFEKKILSCSYKETRKLIHNS